MHPSKRKVIEMPRAISSLGRGVERAGAFAAVLNAV
jgi:hypothetical protein